MCLDCAGEVGPCLQIHLDSKTAFLENTNNTKYWNYRISLVLKEWKKV